MVLRSSAGLSIWCSLTYLSLSSAVLRASFARSGHGSFSDRLPPPCTWARPWPVMSRRRPEQQVSVAEVPSRQSVLLTNNGLFRNRLTRDNHARGAPATRPRRARCSPRQHSCKTQSPWPEPSARSLYASVPLRLLAWADSRMVSFRLSSVRSQSLLAQAASPFVCR